MQAKNRPAGYHCAEAGLFRGKEYCHEGEIISKTDLREM